MNQYLAPPAVIGVIGGGQLGMMTIREAQRMGYRSVIWDPDPACPASHLADDVITAAYDDSEAAARFERLADVVTYEFEHIDTKTVESLERTRTVKPGSAILHITQNRQREKEELRRRGFPVVPFAIVRDRTGLDAAIESVGLPVIVKTTDAGYDGKGQTILTSMAEVAAWSSLSLMYGRSFVVERFIDPQCEISVIVVRDDTGMIVHFPIARNEHRENILHSSVVPAGIDPSIQTRAVELARSMIESFGMTGVLCVEMFVTKTSALIVNELAPRPHNSGHYSLDACDLSQFEALVRVVTGLPLRPPALLTPCAIVNVLGKHLARLDLPAAHKIRGAKLHLYGKRRIEPKRKMGHISILRSTPEDVEEGIAEVERLIGEAR
jgi:5-(carboxyamino)imidazole ribonucleotide synthase